MVRDSQESLSDSKQVSETENVCRHRAKGRDPQIRASAFMCLAHSHPRLANEWHPRNAPLSPHDVTTLFSDPLWWQCKDGHDWQETIEQRICFASSCKQCQQRNTMLALSHPQIAAEWSSKNANLTPEQVLWNSDAKMWWRCSVALHADYQNTVESRTRKNYPAGCPACHDARSESLQSFVDAYTQIKEEWLGERNGRLDKVVAAADSSELFLWCCVKRKHHWFASLLDRMADIACPWCQIENIPAGSRLSERFPDIAREWHPTKNGYLFKVAKSNASFSRLHNRRLGPADVSIESEQMIWWRCENLGHVWCDSVLRRTAQEQNCPECGSLPVVDLRSLAEVFPAVASHWDYELNESLKPSEVRADSARVFRWRCLRFHNHRWSARIERLVAQKSANINCCHWCRGGERYAKRPLLSVFPEVARLWHPTKNIDLSLDEVISDSRQVAWWTCGKHEFQAQIAYLVASYKPGRQLCPRCRPRPPKKQATS